MEYRDAFKVFTKTLRSDKGLYRAFQANIAMAYYDCARWEGSRDSSAKRHAIGNRAADHFLALLLKPVRPHKKAESASTFHQHAKGKIRACISEYGVAIL